MRTSRRSSGSHMNSVPSIPPRLQGRITKEDIRAAHLRRWDGQKRITTDWFNLFNEPELFFPNGDVLVYLREPGKSSRGPAFRVHKTQLKERGFDFLLERCVDQAFTPHLSSCMRTSCPGCDKHGVVPSELYMPAPPSADIHTTFEHHITSRNFFAWLYNIPLAGRALGSSLVALKERIDFYRPESALDTKLEVVSYAETQRYLDFRECIDHALAALHFAEFLELEDLWVDAFAHCVGMSHRGLRTSIEYPTISLATRMLISRSRSELDLRMERVSRAVEGFFETTLSGNFFGLPQADRDHFDRFRSWLHSFYIEQHGFWPPYGFENSAKQQQLYSSMYSDFRNLYHHLVDLDLSTESAGNTLSGSGGVCMIQNVLAFDAKHKYTTLPNALPMLPVEPSADVRPNSLHRRQSWNPLSKKKLDKETRNGLRMQALVASSNRDWTIMDCLLVRRYSEFEANSILDDSDTLPMVDGRKVRWLLIYAILQTLISVMQAPSQVRNTEGLSYALCCRAPEIMPWQDEVLAPELQETKAVSKIEPDMSYIHPNLSEDFAQKLAQRQTKKERRQSLPSRAMSLTSRPIPPRSKSLRRLMTLRSGVAAVDENEPVPAIKPAFKANRHCEILVQGYGNGLNEVTHVAQPDIDQNSDSTRTPTTSTSGSSTRSSASTKSADEEVETERGIKAASSNPSVSRESSTASTTSNRSNNSTLSTASSSVNEEPETPTQQTKKSIDALRKMLQSTHIHSATRSSCKQILTEDDFDKDLNEIVDEQGYMTTVHFNTKTWDDFLGAIAN